jgi:hypothetical protein
MARRETEVLVDALEACADALERHAGGMGATAGGSLPRLRPPSFGAAVGRMAPHWPGEDMPPDSAALALDALELAAEFRDVAEEVQRGNAGRGWINSLLGRASRHLTDLPLERVRAAALGVV